METGIKEKDTYHVARVVMAEYDYFVMTDDRLLKFQSGRTAYICVVRRFFFIRFFMS